MSSTKTEIPDATMATLRRYIDHHIPTGDFLRAVLCNDLKGAIVHADASNVIALPAIVRWLLEEAPPLSWGSPGMVRSWESQTVDP